MKQEAGTPRATEPPAELSFRVGRVLIAGCLLVALTSIIVASAELVAQTIQIGMMQLPPAVVALLFLLALFNRGLRWLDRRAESMGKMPRPRWAFTSRELAALFVMMLFGAMLASRGLMERLLPIQVALGYYAEANRWDTLYFPYLQPFMIPWSTSNPQPEPLVRWFFQRIPYGEPIPWGAWIGSTLNWLVLIGAAFFAFLCISVLLRKQWVENERLAFPLVQLPLELIRGGEFLTNRTFWLGALLPLFVFTLNGLHKNIPTIPHITLDYSLNALFTNPPLDRLTFFRAYLSFAAVGFFFLIPTELLFSFWFFYLLSKGLEILGLMNGFETEARHAAAAGFIKWTCSGAFFAVALYILYSARHHLRYIGRVVVGREPPPPRGSELMSYRVAFWGLVIAFLVIILWCVRMGMDWWVSAVVFAIYLFVQGLVMARCTAEGGLLITEGCFTPMDVVTLEKYALFTPRNLTVMAFVDGLFTRDLRGITITGYLDAQKLGEEVRLNRQVLLYVILGGILLAIGAAFLFQLWLPYHYGALNLYPYVYQHASVQFFRENAPFMTGGQDAPIPSYRPLFLGLGFVVTLALAWARSVFVGFPFHPLGFAMSATWGVVVLWFSMLVAWLIKAPLLRYGGMAMYRRARPFFLGMIFGEFFSAAVWALLALLFRVETPDYPWP